MLQRAQQERDTESQLHCLLPAGRLGGAMVIDGQGASQDEE